MRANEHTVTARFTQIGAIKKSHGLSGEVLVACARGTSSYDLVGLEVWITPPTDRVHHGVITSIAWVDEQTALIAIDSLTSLNDTFDLSRHRLICRSADLPSELIARIDEPDMRERLLDYQVFDERYGKVGRVSAYLETKANDVLEVSGQYGEVLLPVIDDVIVSIDDENRRIQARVLPGLIEE